MQNENIAKSIRRAIKRRNSEYIGLSAFFSFFAYSFISETNIIVFSILLLTAIITGFCLCQKREERRILDFANKYRAIADIIESLTFMLAISILSIIAFLNGFPFIIFEAYLTYSLLGYFIGALFGETFWRNKRFKNLQRKEILNYANNLNSSIILPFNIERKGKFQ